MVTTASDLVEIGRALGFDLVRYRGWHLRDGLPASLVEGMEAAQAARVRRTASDRFVNKWLQLRLNAFRRGRVVDGAVSPDFLRHIDVPVCPVTRVTMTHGESCDTDWSIDRINNDGGYAPGNLVVMSVRANGAKGDRAFDAVLERSRLDVPADGLSPVEWLRLASLMLGPCHAGRASHAPVIPLAAAVAPCAAQPAVQVIQYVFTSATTRPAANALIRRFGRACNGTRSRLALEDLVEAMHRALKDVAVCWDAWLQPEVLRAFIAWRSTLDASAWATAFAIARAASATEAVAARTVDAWRLDRRGYLH